MDANTGHTIWMNIFQRKSTRLISSVIKDYLAPLGDRRTNESVKEQWTIWPSCISSWQQRAWSAAERFDDAYLRMDTKHTFTRYHAY